MGYQRFSQIALESNEDTARVEEAIDVTQRQNSTDPKDIRKVKDYKEQMREMLERKAEEEDTDTNTDTDNEESNDQDTATDETEGYDAGDEADPAAADDTSDESSSDSSDSTSTKDVDDHKEASNKGAEQAADQAEKALECYALAYEVYSDIIDAQAKGTIRHLDIADKVTQLKTLGAPYGAKLDISKHLSSLSTESYSDHPYTLGQMELATEGFLSSVGEAISEFIQKLLSFIKDIVLGNELSYSASSSALEKAAAENEEASAKCKELEDRLGVEKDDIKAKFQIRQIKGCAAILGPNVNNLNDLAGLIEDTYKNIKYYVDGATDTFGAATSQLGRAYQSVKRWQSLAASAPEKKDGIKDIDQTELTKTIEIRALVTKLIPGAVKFQGVSRISIANKISPNADVVVSGPSVKLCGNKMFALVVPPERNKNQTLLEFAKAVTGKGNYGFYIEENIGSPLDSGVTIPCNLDVDEVNKVITTLSNEALKLRDSYTHLKSASRKLSDWEKWIRDMGTFNDGIKDKLSYSDKQIVVESNKLMIAAMKVNLSMFRGIVGLGLNNLDSYMKSIYDGVHRYNRENKEIYNQYQAELVKAVRRYEDKARQTTLSGK